MKLLQGILLAASAATLISSTAIQLDRRDSPLTVSLAAEGNTKVKISVTNTGSTDLNLLNKGTFLDHAAVEKLDVYKADSKLPFEGIRYRISTDDLPEDAFTYLAAGQTLNVTVDMGAVHDLSAGGAYTVITQGAVPVAEAGSTVLTGKALYYQSNSLDVNVDGAAAALVERALKPLDRRSAVQSDCTGSFRTETTNALRLCASMANAAADAAASGSASKFAEFFQTTSSSVRSIVAARFRAVANECSSSTSGNTDYYCTDVYGQCFPSVIAYTYPRQSLVVNCPRYFRLPALANSCYSDDQASTTLHEMTHAPSVYSPGTQDNAYGYYAATSLSVRGAVSNADSYALYAQSVYLDC